MVVHQSLLIALQRCQWKIKIYTYIYLSVSPVEGAGLFHYLLFFFVFFFTLYANPLSYLVSQAAEGIAATQKKKYPFWFKAPASATQRLRYPAIGQGTVKKEI